MASTLEDREPAADARPLRKRAQADYLPQSYGAPVAAGPEIDSLDARSARLDGGRRRRLVPTPRQYENGMEYPDFAATELTSASEPEPKPSRRERVGSYFSGVNPLQIPGPKMPLVVFGLLALLQTWDDAALGIIAPELRAEFGLSIQTLVNYALLTTFFSLFAGLPMGYLVDRVKRVRLVRFGQIIGNVASILQAMVTGQAGYFGAGLVKLASGMAGGPAQGPLMADYYPSRARARVFAFLSIAGKIGGLLGLPIAGFLIVQYGWRAALLALGLFATLVSCLTFFLREPVRGGMDRLELGVSREAAFAEFAPPSWQEGLRAAWAVRTMRRTAYAGVVRSFTMPISVVLGIIQAEKFFLDAGQRATLGFVTGALTIPALIIGGKFADRLLTIRPATMVAFQAGLYILTGAITLVNGLAPSLVLLVVFTVTTACLSAMIDPASAAIMSLVVPARARGVGMAVYTPFALIGLLLVKPLTDVGLRISPGAAIAMFSPFYVIAGLIVLSTAATIERDIRAARAAAMAGEETYYAKKAGEEKLLVCRDIDVAYDGVQILFHVDLDVHTGECLALVGTNGAGKSTLLRAIAGVVEAENGAIFFDGEDITHVPAHESVRRGIVMMPGGAAVFPTMTVRENLKAAAWMQRRDDATIQAGIERVLELFPVLRDRLDVQAGTMSGGEQQMLALSQAFLIKPRLLMIDELSLGLAPAVIELLLGVLRQIRADGTTVILVEQSLNVALTVAERAVFMEKGEIHFDGPTEELLRRPDLVRSIFMGGAVGGSAPRSRRTRRAGTEDEAGPVLTVEAVSIAFGGVQALREVSLAVAPGEIVGIIGPNGAGKTTLFDVISGYVKPDEGHVLVEDDDVTALTPDARARLGLGRAFQNARLFPPLTVRENIALALERRANKSPVLAALWAPQVRQSERRIATRVDGYIEILGLGPFADKFVRELSTGTRRAVEVACQMAAEPKMLLLDEPSSGLAQAESEALGPALTRVVRETDCGLLVIEHDLPLVMGLSDRLVAMELGEVIVTGTPVEVTSHPRVLQSYIAASSDVIERSGSRVGSVLSAITSQEKGNTQ